MASGAFRATMTAARLSGWQLGYPAGDDTDSMPGAGKYAVVFRRGSLFFPGPAGGLHPAVGR